MKPPVFLLASERSGTNLLRRRLTEYQKEYFGPAPLHLLKHLYWAEPYYGDLACEGNFREFIRDALGLAYHHFSPWDEEISVDQVQSEYDSIFQGQRSSVGVMHVIYSIYAWRKGYSSYFCKDNNIFDFVSDIKLLIPESKFVYLYRDPRDVVVSQMKRPLQNKSVSFLADLWRNEQVRCIRHAKFLESSNDVMMISYEDLIQDELLHVKRLCDFLNVEKLETKENFSVNENIQIQEWENLNKPTIKGNSGKFLESLSRSKLKKIEGICWHQMVWLGYQPVSSRREYVSYKKLKIDVFFGIVIKILTSRLKKSGTTEEQMDRAKYTNSLQAKWR
ncbi:sulfotransferase family protein [Marinobacter sp. GN3S48]|uniref:sulfotransferase family protein n=1 Tax=Marinobacter sp. GN3S48 TaxID=3382302 RepID=UPI00387B3317